MTYRKETFLELFILMVDLSVPGIILLGKASLIFCNHYSLKRKLARSTVQNLLTAMILSMYAAKDIFLIVFRIGDVCFSLG